jgi:quercetin 2,3-dioxygenase
LKCQTKKEFTLVGVYYIHASQLWVKLPGRDEMIKPRHLDITSSKIPLAQTGDGAIKVKIFEGEALDVRAINYTQTPIFYLHFTPQPRAKSSITSTKKV